VGHVRQELGFVLTGDFQLPALVRDLTEETSVLDGQGGLGGERFQDVHDFRRELAWRLAVEGQAADDLVLAEQGHGEERPVPEPDEGVPDAALVGSGLGNVGDLDGLAHRGRPPHEPLALPKRRLPESLDEIRVVVVGRAQLEMLGRLVVLVNRAAGIPDQLTGARDVSGAYRPAWPEPSASRSARSA
jgi:hypothetical protein